MNTKSLTKEFQAIVGVNNVMTSETDRLTYSYDSAALDPVLPSLVVQPMDSESLGKTEHGDGVDD